MAVESTVVVSEQAGNGVKLAFDAAMKIMAETDLVVKRKTAAGVYTTLTLGSGGADGFTVVFDSAAETVTVTLVTAPEDGGACRIERDTALTQGSVWPRESKVPAKTYENAVDKLTLIVQELEAEIAAISVAAAAGTLSTIQSGTYDTLDAAAGTDMFLARVTDRRTISLFLGDRALGENGWQVISGY